MGQKQTKPFSSTTPTQKHSAFKLFEYQCTQCKAKRPVQYFYRNGVFLPQNPRVVCGACNTSQVVEPFKTVDCACPVCKKWQKVQLPAKPVPVNMYNVSVITCNCGFRGEVDVGKLMDVLCGTCLASTRELRDVWSEDGHECKTFCERCQDYRIAYQRAPRKKGQEAEAELEYICENCFRPRPIHIEEVHRHDGQVSCTLCNWVGYPQRFVPKGHAASAPPPSRMKSSGRRDSAYKAAKRRVESADQKFSSTRGSGEWQNVLGGGISAASTTAASSTLVHTMGSTADSFHPVTPSPFSPPA
mmetsp:Transcript_20029/g.46064  ORF Transcript_20029/g.46064 Transcript_20029/m.46064 type:complete len:301 (-) Transcript_20029:78-980(-)